jgi:thiol-disulfide isomerase/thioredoxin
VRSRLVLALVPVALVAACGKTPETPQRSRAVGVAANRGASAAAVARWLDVSYEPATAPAFSLPKVVPARPAQAVPALATDHWVWVNLWATWCVPCRREMPLLLAWRDQLARDGISVDLWFLSIDDRQEDLERFLSSSPDTAPGNSVRLAVRRDLEGWLGRFPGAARDAVPLQILVAPGGKVRGIREGSLHNDDYATVKELLK